MRLLPALLFAAAGASDLHLCAGSPPVLRVRGELERIDLPEVSGEEMRALVYRITTLDYSPYGCKLAQSLVPIETSTRFRCCQRST